jgi:hypothetical protein
VTGGKVMRFGARTCSEGELPLAFPAARPHYLCPDERSVHRPCSLLLCSPPPLMGGRASVRSTKPLREAEKIHELPQLVRRVLGDTADNHAP